jgi:acetolactate synthase-1/2/3 large subunit
VPRDGLPWAHVDIEPRRPRTAGPSITVTADAKAFLKAANERLLGGRVLDAERVATAQANNAADRAAWEGASTVDATPWDGPGVHPGRIVTTLRRVLPDDAILTTDAATSRHGRVAASRSGGPGTFIGRRPARWATASPPPSPRRSSTAIARRRARRGRRLAMTMAELETAVRAGARVVVVVFDNERYGTIRMWQERRGTGVGVATELGPSTSPRSPGPAARAVRGRARTPTSRPRSASALVADRPTVIQLTLDKAWVRSTSRPADA